jgi:hypothetical protein
MGQKQIEVLEIRFNSNNEDDQKILEKGLSRLLKPEQLRLLQRLFLGHQ